LRTVRKRHETEPVWYAANARYDRGNTQETCDLKRFLNNDQWRVCFKWIDNNASGVEITDYH